MKYYVPVPIVNLKTIQEKVFNLFPKDILEKKVNNLFYIPNNMNVFLNIPELKQVLDELGWTPNVFLFAFNIVQPNSDTNVHIDSGEMVYSFNIPILNCDDTYVNFYSTTEQPVMTTYTEYDQKINYLKYNLSHCELIDKLDFALELYSIFIGFFFLFSS
jgi:hypothetical protein